MTYLFEAMYHMLKRKQDGRRIKLSLRNDITVSCSLKLLHLDSERFNCYGTYFAVKLMRLKFRSDLRPRLYLFLPSPRSGRSDLMKTLMLRAEQ